jgi:hypothetical protein
MASVTVLRILVGAVSGALALVLAAVAVLLAVQTAPTAPAADAREHVQRLVVDAAAGLRVALTVADGAPCPWLGVDGAPASGQVRPRVEARGPAPADAAAVLDAVAAIGGRVTRGTSTVVVRDAGGYRLTVRVAEEIVLVGESPCVWPRGTREPGP